MELLDLSLDERLSPQIGLLLAALDNATAEWREELGEVPDEMLVWQPYPSGHSIGAIILHIADVEAAWLHDIAAGQARSDEELRRLQHEATDQYAFRWADPPPGRPLRWFYDQHDEVRARTRALIAAIDDPLRTSADTRCRYTLRYLLAHVQQHEAYHGGQAVLLSVLFDKAARPAT